MSTTPSGYPTRLLLLAVLHAPRHDHADVLQMLAEYLVEVVGELLRLPAAVAPHPGDLLGVLEDRVRVISPTEQLTVHMAGAPRGALSAGFCAGGGSSPVRSNKLAVMRVAPAGATALTVMPYSPSSSAQMNVMPIRPAFAAP